MTMRGGTFGQIVLDIETSVVPNASEFFGHIQAPSNYKNPEKIAEYLEKARRDEVDKAALDVDLCRVVTLSFWEVGQPGPLGYVCRNEEQEARVLTSFAKRLRHGAGGLKDLVVFNGLDFDLPALMRRALYLGVKFPNIPVDRFRHNGVIDIMQELSYNGKLKFRGLEFFLRRFGIHVDNPCKGSDIPGLIAAGDYDTVLAHNKADVIGTRLLGERLGLIDKDPVVAAAQ